MEYKKYAKMSRNSSKAFHIDHGDVFIKIVNSNLFWNENTIKRL